MDSALGPREIQERVRAGQSVDEVAEAAGVPPEKIAPFTDPVLVERRFVADTAVSSSLRREADNGTHTTLKSAVSQRLIESGMDRDAVSWDAIRFDDRHVWTVIARWQHEGEDHTAHFRYDVRGRYSTAQDENARWLVQDFPPPPPAPVEPEDDDEGDDEPTVNFAEQFALVDAVSEPSDDSDDSYGPVDIHDLVPTPESELDNLYAMLHGFEEDSVNIYAGLSEPPTPEQVAAGELPAGSDEAPEDAASPQPPADATQDRPSGDDPAAPFGDQPSLLDDEGDAPQQPAPRKSRKRRRASVPSWDEIMFGGAGPKKD